MLGGLTAFVLIVGALFSLTLNSLLFTVIFAVALAAFAAFSFVTFAVSKRSASESQKASLDWESALPEIQRQNLNIEVLELSKILEVEKDQVSDLQSAYIVAEDLALRQIQQEEHVPLMRHVSVAGVPFAGVLSKNGTIVCIEVAFLIAPEMRQDRIDSMLKKAAAVKQGVTHVAPDMSTRLMAVLITQLTPEDEQLLRKDLKTKRFAETPVDIEIRFLDFESLQRIFVTD
jgi:hypothetical protein